MLDTGSAIAFGGAVVYHRLKYSRAVLPPPCPNHRLGKTASPLSMRIYRLFALAVLLPSIALPALPTSGSSSSPVLPRVTAYALDKSKVTLPADFSAPLNLLILSFKPDQQEAAQSWLAAAHDAEQAKVQTWTLPISGREDHLYRWWLNTSIRGNTPPGESKHNIVPLYVNKASFLKSLAIGSEKEVVVLLTDKTGRVLWRSSGAASGEKQSSLRSFLASVPPAK